MKIWGKEEQKRDTEAKIQTHNKCMDMRKGGWDELGDGDWHIYSIDTLYK